MSRTSAARLPPDGVRCPERSTRDPDGHNVEAVHHGNWQATRLQPPEESIPVEADLVLVAAVKDGLRPLLIRATLPRCRRT